MRQPPTQVAHSSVGNDVRANLQWFQRHLMAGNKSPSTIATYSKGIEQLADFLEAKGMPTAVGAIHREHVEAFIVDLQERGWRPASVASRYRSLQQFFKWLDGEGELTENPMVRMKAPMVPEEPPAILRQADKDKLLGAVKGRTFEDLRDNAILRLLLDTGMRRAEIAGLRVNDLDMSVPKHDVATVLGKGRRPRQVPFTSDTATAIHKYEKKRAQRADARSEWLWLGKKGPLTANGILQMVRRRAASVGLDGVYVHLFRHTAAHDQLARGMQEGALMHNMGWRSPQMPKRYGASAAAERAREEYWRLNGERQ